MDLSVCLVATELFGWGRYGGFGASTRLIGEGLAGRGVEVSVVVPKGEEQKPVEHLKGMTIHSFPLSSYPFTGGIYRLCDSDIYHSEEPSWGTLKAREAMPERKHVITCQNPKTDEDWRLVYGYYPLRRRFYNALMEDRIRRGVRMADAVYCQAHSTITKTRQLYGLPRDPGFLPNPVKIPTMLPRKASEPTVCFLGRFDAEKRPELFFELAKEFTDVRFIALGRAHDERLDRQLRERYRGVGNLSLPGLVLRKEKEDVLDEAWVLINTSVSECLPVSFLEASAHRCAILSFHDPDGFAGSFGFHAEMGSLGAGLRWLFEDDRWRRMGEEGYRYVSEIHEFGRVIDLHIREYEKILGVGHS
jgi:glycosyltransferase involved in cell wall biosynthesis